MLKKQWLLVSLFLFLLLFLKQGGAHSSYEVILPAQTQSLEERQILFEQGLLQLLGQLPESETKIKNPTDFVERYAYDEENRLSIHYSADLIDRLRTHVFRVLLWLPENEIEEALQTQLLLFAKDKGLTLVWPLMDLEDRANNLTHAGDRYHTQAVLSGIITEDEAQWHLQRGENSIRWQGERESLASCLMRGLTETAQYLTKPKAPIVPRSEEKPFLITIHNIQSAQDFLEIEDYLRRLDIIKTLTIYQIEEERATFRISSHGGWEEALRLDPHLVPLPLLDLNYRWVP